MSKQEFEQWLEAHHYPQLVLASGDVVRHHEWQQVLAGASERVEEARKRIQAFLARLEMVGADFREEI